MRIYEKEISRFEEAFNFVTWLFRAKLDYHFDENPHDCLINAGLKPEIIDMIDLRVREIKDLFKRGVTAKSWDADRDEIINCEFGLLSDCYFRDYRRVRKLDEKQSDIKSAIDYVKSGKSIQSAAREHFLTIAELKSELINS